MIISDTIQGSEEWLAERAGNVTASCFGNILTGTGKKSTSRKKYLLGLAGERLVGQPEDSFKSPWMNRGNELEPDARNLYEFLFNVEVEQVGMVYLNADKDVSCSPDGLIKRQKRGLEIKCPKSSTHLEYLLGKKCPAKYIPQVQGCMWVTGYDFWDFESYHPNIKHLRVPVERDIKYIALLEESVLQFVDDLKKTVAALT